MAVYKTAIISFQFFVIWGFCLFGQQGSGSEGYFSYRDLVEYAFGQDQNLINGPQYFNRYVNYKGLPYLTGAGFVSGELTIQDKSYSPVRIRYDLYAQQVEIEYSNRFGGFGWLVTVFEHVDAFQLESYPFRKLDLDGTPRFYQVIRVNGFTCFVQWSRKLTPVQNDLSFSHQFSRPGAHCYLELEN